MATSIDVIRDRIASICASAPFSFVEAQTPFSFDLQASGVIDGSYRLACMQGSVIGGFSYSEERTDLVDIWVARKLAAEPTDAYRQLAGDVNSLRAAVIRDGLNGDYFVPDEGFGFSVGHDDGQAYAVLKLTIPVNFETTV